MIRHGLVVFALAIGIVSATTDHDLDTSQQLRQGKLGLLGGTTSMLSTLAQDLLSRSTTSSQVLSLNLTNLVILLVLKAIIFGASTFGFGYNNHGRSVDGIITDNLTKQMQSKAFVSETELLLMLSYLKADSTQKYGCLHRIACEDPYKAKEYLLAAKMVLKGAELFNQTAQGSKYDQVLSDLQNAISHGLKGQDCSIRYTCERFS